MDGTHFRELAEIVRPDTGRHRRPEDGVCTMELVAWMAGEKHSDHPRSASPVIAAFIRPFNDALDGPNRQRLGALAARVLGTRGSREQEMARVQLLWDWMITTAVPGWLHAAGRPDIAAWVATERAGALRTATSALDAHGHAYVRPVDDHRVAETVGRALAASGVTGACVAGGPVADRVNGPRARRHWDAARILARAAAWSAAEASSGWGAGDRVWPTAGALRDSAFTLLDRLIAVTEPARPPQAPSAFDGPPLPQRLTVG